MKLICLYRYFYVPDVKWDMTGEYNPDLTQTVWWASYGLSHFEGDSKDRSVTLALRWNFGAGAG
ncbi:hypothetical protein ACFPN2_32400 [Steroidobacter flavus]|uniref:Uncharacterized protein n=1 Tax=Steroidobacter flavus TaxID=1842136 RepID=A0ABV8T2Y5_9GAMM